MNKIVYEHCGFQGNSREFTTDVPNLVHENFNDCISSLKVIGNPWVVFEHVDFNSAQSIFEEGEYATMEYNDTFSSLQLVKEDLDNPQITLYEHYDYQGQSIVLNSETNLFHGSFNDKISSHKVQRGAWILYQNTDRGGHRWVARAGHDVPRYDWNNNILTHLRPLKSGKPSIKAEIEWDKKTEQISTVKIGSITGVNYGSEKQIFFTEVQREYSASITESFSFSNSTQLSLGTKFEISLFDATTENTLNVSNTFTVETGSSNTRTTTESIKMALPANIPPHTKLTVNMFMKQVALTVPVKLTISKGFHPKVEYGKYRYKGRNCITTEFLKKKITMITSSHGEEDKAMLGPKHSDVVL